MQRADFTVGSPTLQPRRIYCWAPSLLRWFDCQPLTIKASWEHPSIRSVMSIGCLPSLPFLPPHLFFQTVSLLPTPLLSIFHPTSAFIKIFKNIIICKNSTPKPSGGKANFFLVPACAQIEWLYERTLSQTKDIR